MTTEAGTEPPASRSHQLVVGGLGDLLGGRPQAAIPAFEEALYWQKGNPDAYYYLARALIDIGELAAARGTIDTARERFPAIFADGGWGVYPVLGLDGPEDARTLVRNRTPALGDADQTVRRSHDRLHHARTLIGNESFADAVTPLMEALEANPWNVHAYYHLGQAFANSGETEKARTVFTRALDTFPFTFGRTSRFGDYQGFRLDSKTVIAYYEALSLRVAGLSDLLGGRRRDGAAPLADIYGKALADWAAGATPPPRRAAAFRAEDETGARRLADGRSIMWVSPRYIKCDPAWDAYEITHYLADASRPVLRAFHVHYADGFHTEDFQLATPRTPGEVADAIARFRAALAEARPDIVMMDANFMGGMGCISREDLAALKSEFGFKLAALVIDVNPPLPNYAAYWSTVSDLVVAMNGNAYLDEARANCPVMIYPGVPIDPRRMGTPAGTRDIDVLFVGARKRYRDMWCAQLLEGGIDLHLRFTEQSLANSLRADEFIGLHRRAKLLFNNNLISSTEHALNLRPFEAVTTGVVLLQQDFQQLRDYFQPYVHYAPFTSAPEMVETARLLLARDDLRAAIAGNAQDWFEQCYGAERFWLAVVERLAA